MEFFHTRILQWLPFPSLGIFLTQGSNLSLLCLLHCRQSLYLLGHWGSPKYYYTTIVVHNPWLVESKDVEGWIQKACFKVIHRFLTGRRWMPLTPTLFKGSAILPMWAFIKNFPNHWWRPSGRLSDFHLPDPLVTK